MAGSVANVDCQKQVRLWRLLRSLMELLVPCCNTAFMDKHEMKYHNYLPSYYFPQPNFISGTTITGTIFGCPRGKVSLCIQTSSKSTTPILLLELAVPTATLAREMQGGILRIALECSSASNGAASYYSLLSVPVWTMYCNGRRVGFAVKRRPSKADTAALRLMGSVMVGAGTISGKELDRDDKLMYLRANFKRVRGSSDSESFHLIDPEGSIGQELSIFFIRSR